ncbi:hypothetical protein [Paenibacillus sp. FSL R10-2736]
MGELKGKIHLIPPKEGDLGKLKGKIPLIPADAAKGANEEH